MLPFLVCLIFEVFSNLGHFLSRHHHDAGWPLGGIFEEKICFQLEILSFFYFQSFFLIKSRNGKTQSRECINFRLIWNSGSVPLADVPKRLKIFILFREIQKILVWVKVFAFSISCNFKMNQNHRSGHKPSRLKFFWRGGGGPLKPLKKAFLIILLQIFIMSVLAVR